jgi:hypothetical protein
MSSRKARLERRWGWAGLVALYLLFLAVDAWVVFVLPQGPWQDKASLVLAIVGFFGLGVGLLNRSELARALPGYINIDKMTSHNLRRFVAGNLAVLGASAPFMISLVYGRDPWSREGMAIGWRVALFPLSLISAFATLAMCLLWFVACGAYLVVVAPFSYLAFAAVSLPLLRIRDSGPHAYEDPPEFRDIHTREIVKDNLVDFRAFLVGVISPTFAFVIKLIQLY